ncbi:MAG: ABC transporter ATP-binding protein [Spirochaetales bacterium]|nr:ABC transporter ATP-binding protein [Spirochaetales bacterium]
MKINTKSPLGIFSLLKGFRLIYSSAIVSLAAASLVRTVTFILLRHVIDNVYANHDLVNQVLPWACAFIGLACIEGTASFGRGILASFATKNVIQRLRNFLYDHIQRLRFSYHDHMQTGELLERVTSDVETLETFFAEQATEVGRILTLFVFNLTALFALNTTIGLLSIVFVPVVILISMIFFVKIEKAFTKYQEQEAVLSSLLQENLSAIRVVKAFARQAFESKRFDGENQEKYARGRKVVLLHACFWPVSDIICTIQMLLVFFVGATMAIQGTITAGIYVACCGLTIAIVWPVRNLGQIIIQASNAFVSFKRVAVIIEEKQEMEAEDSLKEMDTDLKGKVEFNEVCFRYKETEEVLDNISFTCKPGEKIALLGSTGSGKTSLVSLLPRFYPYGKGSIRIDGRELRDIPHKIIRGKIGIVEQEPFLFSRTIRENIAFGVERKVTDGEIKAAAEAAAIHEVIKSFPRGYDTIVGEKGVTLSGGQKQRIAIARALLRDPRILILDDATSSVDADTEHRIQDALDVLMEGRTTFIIAHRIQTVMNADKILVLDKGRIVQEGTHSQLASKDGFYRRISELQLSGKKSGKGKEKLYA